MELIADSWEKMVKAAGFFQLDMDKFGKLEAFFDSLDKDFFRNAASRILKDFPRAEVEAMFERDDQFRFLLLVIVANAEKLQQLYRQNNYPEWMLELIARDLNIWMPTMEAGWGFYCLDWEIFDWQSHCMTGAIKQFGRLQCNNFHAFNVKKCFYRDEQGALQMVEDKSQVPAGITQMVAYQDPCINLHIPASGPLDRKECIRAIANMVDFYREFFPEYHYRAFVCYSWLLDKQFRKLLPPESNIIRYQDLGHNFDMPEISQDLSVCWRLWDYAAKTKEPDQLVCRTSLHHKVVEFWKNGGHFIEGGLIIFPDELPALFQEIGR